jgi:acyl-CoA synthetase (NDP forming)
MTDQGQRSATSHTGALATDHRIWEGLAAQFGLTLATSIEEFAGDLVGLSLWREGPPAGRRCCLAGPGGVLSVLGTDLLRRHGLDVPALGAGTLARLEALRLPPGSSVRNPIDTPVGVMQAKGGHAFGEILRLVAGAGEVDWFVVHVSLQNLYSYLGDPETALEHSIAGFLEVARECRDRARFCLVLRTNGDPALDPVRARYRALAVARGVPTFGRLEEAAPAIAAFVRRAEHVERARSPSREDPS